MENIIYIILIILTILLFKIIFKINLKKAKEMLEMLDNKDVKIEEAKNTETSLYIAITNKISIADMKNNYARIQTIAHECLHSCQDRTLLMFNFIFSNINMIYFFIITILTLFKVINNQMLQIAILMLFNLIQFAVRSFLEIDAMRKSRFLAKEYMEKKNLCSNKEIDNLLEQYDKINKIGIPFVIDNLLTNGLIRILIYTIISVVV